MKHIIVSLLTVVFLTSCGSQQKSAGSHMTSIQIEDKNGFKETISSIDRLKVYERADFLTPQPYDKVVRMYSRGEDGKTLSKITTYHENGEPWQYLEVLNGRACGVYREWHNNGSLRLDVVVIEGVGDLSEETQVDWVFDGISRAWDERGNLLAEINYEKGKLQGNSLYYHRNGKVCKIIPYEHGLIDGELLVYNEKGNLIGKTPYRKGKREGIATYKGDQNHPCYSEEYHDDQLLEATYHDFSGKITHKIIKGCGKQPIYIDGKVQTIREYREGVPEGEIQVFDQKGYLKTAYHMRNGMKHGPEWIYYPLKDDREPIPMLYIEWQEDHIQGISRSWYPNGKLESERELINNQKHGISSAWYLDGSLMFVEEYENDVLQKGNYLKKGESRPVSTIEYGEGTATLFDKDGYFLKRVLYHKGQVVDGL